MAKQKAKAPKSLAKQSISKKKTLAKLFKKSASTSAKTAKAAGTSTFDQALVTWMAPEFLRYEKTRRWMLIALVFDALFVLYAFATSSWSMALVFILLPVVFYLEHRQKPRMVEVKISAYGIQFGTQRLPYSEIKAFWILHHPPAIDELILKVDNRLHPEVAVPLLGIDPSLIRNYLVTQIVEWEGKTPSALELIIRALRLH
jgi:hypothetical protein